MSICSAESLWGSKAFAAPGLGPSDLTASTAGAAGISRFAALALAIFGFAVFDFDLLDFPDLGPDLEPDFADLSSRADMVVVPGLQRA
jgi:hypothetical protein